LTQHLLSGPWSQVEIGEFLRQSIVPLRLSAISPAGWPVIVSLWYLYEEGVIRCASRRHARIISLLEKNPRCAFEIAGEAPPYFGVRGQGMASIDPDGAPELLTNLVNRYLGTEETPFRRWLLAGAMNETSITIRPIRFMSWDYRDRMGP
jgi:hypothetical protein